MRKNEYILHTLDQFWVFLRQLRPRVSIVCWSCVWILRRRPHEFLLRILRIVPSSLSASLCLRRLSNPHVYHAICKRKQCKLSFLYLFIFALARLPGYSQSRSMPSNLLSLKKLIALFMKVARFNLLLTISVKPTKNVVMKQLRALSLHRLEI